MFAGCNSIISVPRIEKWSAYSLDKAKPLYQENLNLLYITYDPIL